MECVILYRNIWTNEVGYITDSGKGFDAIAVFPNMDAAVTFVEGSELLQVCPYKIVELPEL